LDARLLTRWPVFLIVAVSGVAFEAISATFSVVLPTGPFPVVLLARDRAARVELLLPRELVLRPRELRVRGFPRLPLVERLGLVDLLVPVLRRVVLDRVV
jgi:hypothetical protein